MIRSFRDKGTERLFLDEDVPRFRAIERQARRKLLLIDAAAALDAKYGLDVDYDSIERLCAQHRLTFPA